MYSADSPKFVSQDFVSLESEISPSVGFLLQTNDQNFDQSELLHWDADEISDNFPASSDNFPSLFDWFDNDDLI